MCNARGSASILLSTSLVNWAAETHNVHMIGKPPGLNLKEECSLLMPAAGDTLLWPRRARGCASLLMTLVVSAWGCKAHQAAKI